MIRTIARFADVGFITVPLVACAEQSKIPEEQSFGPSPILPPPTREVIPTVNIAKAKGWPEGRQPKAASGLTVTAFATGLAHPRTVRTLPNGDVLVTETDAPPKEESQGIK